MAVFDKGAFCSGDTETIMRLLRLAHSDTLSQDVCDTYEIPEDWDVPELLKKHGENFGGFLENSEAKKVKPEVLDFYNGRNKYIHCEIVGTDAADSH